MRPDADMGTATAWYTTPYSTEIRCYSMRELHTVPQPPLHGPSTPTLLNSG